MRERACVYCCLRRQLNFVYLLSSRFPGTKGKPGFKHRGIEKATRTNQGGWLHEARGCHSGNWRWSLRSLCSSPSKSARETTARLGKTNGVLAKHACSLVPQVGLERFIIFRSCWQV